MKREFFDRNPNCLKFYSLIYQHALCKSIRSWRYRKKKWGNDRLIKNCMSENPILWIWVLRRLCGPFYKALYTACLLSTCTTDNSVLIFWQDGAPSNTVEQHKTIQRNAHLYSSKSTSGLLRVWMVILWIMPYATFSRETSTDTGQKSSLSRNWEMLLYGGGSQ